MKWSTKYGRRMLKLADHLETVPRNKFDMSLWFHGCGTAACAMGHACNVPAFRRLGLRPNAPTFGVLIPKIIDKELGVEHHGFSAAMYLFGLTKHEAMILFGSHNRLTPKQCAKRLRKFVEEKTLNEV